MRMNERHSPPQHRLSRRAVLLAGILIPLNAWWVVQEEIIRGETLLTTISILANVIFCLFFLALGNRLLTRFAPRLAFQQAELVLITMLLAAGSAMAGLDMTLVLLPNLGHATWFASPQNHWQTLVRPFLSPWLNVTDRAALRGYYQGDSTLFTLAHLRAWAVPFLTWSAFMALMLWVMLCLNSLLRRQWAESERLSYPLVWLPLELSQQDSKLFGRRLFWAGFSLAGGMDLVNGLHFFFPAVPTVPLLGTTGLINLGANFTSRPWDAITWSPLCLFPFAIGIGFLLPVDLLFSCWFFVLFWKVERVLASAWGYTLREYEGFPDVHQQMLGGYIGICAFSLWVSRGHLRRVWHTAWQPASRDDADEPLRFRQALIGLAGGGAALTLFGVWIGLPAWLALLFFLLYLVISLGVTRMRAELGAPVHDLHFLGPDTTLASLCGTANLNQRALVALTELHWFNRAYRTHPMPHQLEGFKMAQVASLRSRGLPLLMLGAALWGMGSAYWTFVHTAYQQGTAAQIHGYGALNFARENYNRLDAWITSPTPPDRGSLLAIGAGCLFALALTGLRLRLAYFPFHALGYAIGGDYAMNFLWCSLLLSWLIKSALLRYGGLRAYAAALPCFFGLIVGEFTVGGLWTLVGLALGVPSYSFWDV
jgi:hypothetical protein